MPLFYTTHTPIPNGNSCHHKKVENMPFIPQLQVACISFFFSLFGCLGQDLWSPRMG